MSGSVGSRRRTWLVGVLGVAVVLLSGCQWTLPSYSVDGTRHNTAETTVGVANAASLATEWSTPLGSASLETVPVSAAGKVVVSLGGQLQAFAVDGAGAACTAGPPTCAPVWRTSGPFGPAVQPVVIGDRVALLSPSYEVRLYDLAGEVGCSGDPKVCTPVATMPSPFTGQGWGAAMITVSKDLVIVANQQVIAYPRSTFVQCVTDHTCSPAWTFDPVGIGDDVFRVVVDGATVYATVHDHAVVGTERSTLVALDGTGVAGCAGTPVLCSPRWRSTPMSTGSSDLLTLDGTVVVATDTIAPRGSDPEGPGAVQAFTVAGCAAGGVPCAPSWTATTNLSSQLAAADGVLFATDEDPYRYVTRAFDLHGVDGCAGTPTVCAPLRTMVDTWTSDGGPPALANGLLYVGADVFDATGAVGCVAATHSCAPVRIGNGSGATIVVNGRVHRVVTPSISFGAQTLVTEHVVS